MNRDDFSNSCMMTHPLERHVFEGPSEECAACGRTRAFHQDAGFIPGNPPHVVCMDPHARYKGSRRDSYGIIK
jgi:hypothetical protein